MQELKNKIIELISKGKIGAYDYKRIEEELKMHKTSDFIMLNKALSEMEDNYEIIRKNNNHFVLPSQANYYTGEISINSKGSGFLDIDDRNSIYINQKNINGALDRDLVAVKLIGDDINGEGIVEKIIKRNTNHLIGTFESYKGKLQCVLDDSRIQGKVSVKNMKDYKLVNGMKAQFQILSLGKVNELKIIKLLGHKDQPGVDILSILLEYDINSEFPKEVKKQVESIPQEINEKDKKDRKDCTDLITVTIDGDDSKDFDDAISIVKEKDKYRLYVHIADVSYYVEDNTPLDTEARFRGTSTYVTDRVVPMLPFELSNGICSLNEGVERLTLTCEMLINKKGEVDDYAIYPSYIKSNARMTYNNVNKILANDEEVKNTYKSLGNIFEQMDKCASFIRFRREKNGAIDFDTEEAKIKVDKNGKPYDIVLRERGKSERIIEDFMIAANECVAKHMKYLELPCLYRIHEQPLQRKMREFVKITKIFGHTFKGSIEDVRPKQIQECLYYFKNTPSYPVISTMMLRTMQKARYDNNCLGHFGLGLDEYLHFTSPIRRYPDLIVHRMLRKYCFEKDTNPMDIAHDEILMEDLGNITSDRERASTQAERDVDDMKMAEYMEDKIGEIHEGVISSITKFGIFVELPNTIEGLIRLQDMQDDYYVYDQNNFTLIGERTGKTYHLGDEVVIKVIGASKQERTIDFAFYRRKEKRKQRWI